MTLGGLVLSFVHVCWNVGVLALVGYLYVQWPYGAFRRQVTAWHVEMGTREGGERAILRLKWVQRTSQRPRYVDLHNRLLDRALRGCWLHRLPAGFDAALAHFWPLLWPWWLPVELLVFARVRRRICRDLEADGWLEPAGEAEQ